MQKGAKKKAPKNMSSPYFASKPMRNAATKATQALAALGIQ